MDNFVDKFIKWVQQPAPLWDELTDEQRKKESSINKFFLIIILSLVFILVWLYILHVQFDIIK